MGSDNGDGGEASGKGKGRLESSAAMEEQQAVIDGMGNLRIYH
jgi:hypothetical protein